MDKAFALLARGGPNAQAGASSSAAEPTRSVEVVEKTGGNESELDIVAGSSRLKRPRADPDKRQVSKQRLDDRTRHGIGKSLVFTGIPKPLPPILQPIVPFQLEVQPNEHWSAGSNPPLQVFRAFNLPQDCGAYVEKPRGEIADRCLTRGGRFLADLTHIIEAYRADCGSRSKDLLEDELRQVKEKLVITEKRFVEAHRREEDAVRKSADRLAELSKVEKENASLARELKALKIDGAVDRKKIGELESEIQNLKVELKGREDEVATLQVDVEKGVADIAHAIGVGYTKCLERLTLAGLDVSGHSFEDYCRDLTAEMAEKRDVEPTEGVSKAGDAP